MHKQRQGLRGTRGDLVPAAEALVPHSECLNLTGTLLCKGKAPAAELCGKGPPPQGATVARGHHGKGPAQRGALQVRKLLGAPRPLHAHLLVQ